MGYAIALLLGVAAGAFFIFSLFEAKRKEVRQQKQRQDEAIAQAEAAQVAARTQQEQLDQWHRRLSTEAAQLRADRATYEAHVISYKQLHDENAILKRDLRNIELHVRKVHLDGSSRDREQIEIRQRADVLASRYLQENVKWISNSLNANNYANCKQRLVDVIERCRGIGYDISHAEQTELLAELEAEYKKVVRAALEREEQARIKAQIREEAKFERERERELKQLDREREAMQPLWQSHWRRLRTSTVRRLSD